MITSSWGFTATLCRDILGDDETTRLFGDYSLNELDRIWDLPECILWYDPYSQQQSSSATLSCSAVLSAEASYFARWWLSAVGAFKFCDTVSRDDVPSSRSRDECKQPNLVPNTQSPWVSGIMKRQQFFPSYHDHDDNRAMRYVERRSYVFNR